MPTTEQNELENRLLKAATDSTHAPSFLALLIDATVIVPGIRETAAGDAGDRLGLPALLDDSGNASQPFYTSEDRLHETLEALPKFEARFLAVRCRDFWEATRGAELVLNPHSAYGKRFLPQEVAQLLDGRAPLTEHVVEAPTPVLIGEPARVPEGMKEALSTLFARQPLAQSAYLGWKVNPSSGEETYMLVLVGPAGLREAINDDLGRALVFYSQAHPVDVMYALPGEDHILSGIRPFYGATG